MINQLGKFSPNLAELSQSLHELLSTKRSCAWGPDQERAYSELIAELTPPTVLPLKPTQVSADASSFCLGAVLLQQSDKGWKAVAYASRSMTETERQYAQIEKEALATTWACEKLTDYILGRDFLIETDHKPLVSLLNSKHVDHLPPRMLRFRLRLARYNYMIQHVPGKLLYTAHTLSQAPITDAREGTQQLETEVETFIEGVIATLLASQR